MTQAICKTCGQSYDLNGQHNCPGLFPEPPANPCATGLREGNTAVDILDAEVKRLRAELSNAQCSLNNSVKAHVRVLVERDALRAGLEKIASYKAGTVDAGMAPWTARVVLDSLPIRD